MRVRPVGLVWIALVLAVVTACGSAGPAPVAAPAPGGSSAPALTVANLAGGTFDVATLAGKPAVLWFWAPWCATCAGQAETVRGLADTYRGRVAVVGVAGLDKKPEMADFVKIFKLQNMTHLADEQGTVWRYFGIVQQSVYVLLDATGAVVHRGQLSNDVLAERVAALAKR